MVEGVTGGREGGRDGDAAGAAPGVPLPEYIRWFYTDETGQSVMTFAIVWEIIGILVIRKMSNPKF